MVHYKPGGWGHPNPQDRRAPALSCLLKYGDFLIMDVCQVFHFSQIFWRPFMGKGDRRTRRGKIWRGTHGKYRLKAKKLRKIKAQKEAK